MKKIFSLLAILGLVAGCNNEDITTQDPTDISATGSESIEVTVEPFDEIGGSNLRVSWDVDRGERGGYAFDDGDDIGFINITNATQNQRLFSYNAESKLFTGNTALTKDNDYVSYYPYLSAVKNNTEYTFPIAIEQAQTENGKFGNFGKYAVLFGSKVTGDKKTEVKTNLKMAGVVFKVVIENDLATQTIQSIAITNGTVLNDDDGTKNLFSKGITIDFTDLEVADDETGVKPPYLAASAFTFSDDRASAVTLYTREAGKDGYILKEGNTYTAYIFAAVNPELIPTDKSVNISATIQTTKGTLKTTNVALKKDALEDGIHKMVILPAAKVSSLTAYTAWAGKLYSKPYIDGTNIYIYRPDELAWVSNVTAGKNLFNTSVDDDYFTAEQSIYKGFADYTIILKSDIDLNNKVWQPIDGFKGTFNGNGKTIKNFKNTSGGGLFGTNSGIINKLNIDNAIITYVNTSEPEACAVNAGILVGTNNLVGEISNCNITGSSINALNTKIADASDNTAAKNIGGLVGYNKGKISKCTVEANVVGGTIVGGIAGINTYQITGCTSNSTIFAATLVGGITGSNTGTIQTCTNNAAVGASNTSKKIPNATTNIGGITGRNGSSSAVGTVSNCINNGDVGNLIGSTLAGSTKKLYCKNVGGLVGNNLALSKITNGTVAATIYTTLTKAQVKNHTGFAGVNNGTESGSVLTGTKVTNGTEADDKVFE